jgi:hypothetical protein
MTLNSISVVEFSTASRSISTRKTQTQDFLSYSGIEKSGGSSRTWMTSVTPLRGIIMDKQQKSSGGNDNAAKEQLLKRNSLFGDEIIHFDPSELDDDDWRDVFDDDDQPTDDVFSDDNDDDDNDNNPSALMPPPADERMASTMASFNLGDKPFLDQGIKRRRRTAPQIERAENWPPAQMWDSEAADIPHRHAMIQAM